MGLSLRYVDPVRGGLGICGPTAAQRPYVLWAQKHADWVYSVALSPGGDVLASGSWDKTIRLWRVQDWSLVQTLTGHTGGVYSVAFSPDGTLVASGSYDNTIKLWSTSDGSLFRTLQGHTGTVFCVAFSPDGNTIASTSADNTIRLWRVPDGSLMRTYHVETVSWSVAFSPDGRLAACGTDKMVVWDPSKLALGDLDLDGRVMLGDVLMALGCALGLVPVTPERLESGDVNHNGRIDVADVVLILRATVGLIVL